MKKLIFAFAFIVVVANGLVGFAQDQYKHNALHEIKVNGRWGFIDSCGKIVVSAKYSRICRNFIPETEGYCVRNENGWVSIRIMEDNVVYNRLPCDVDTLAISARGNGLYIVVTQEGKLHIINSTGNIAIPCDTEGFGSQIVKDGLIPFRQNGKWGVATPDGQIVVEPSYDFVHNYSERKSAVRVNSKYGFIDSTGNMIIKPQYVYAGPFVKGLALAWNGKNYFYIKSSGNKAFDKVFQFGSDFSEGLAAVDPGSGCMGYINMAGEYAIKPQYTRAGDFSEGLANVEFKSSEGSNKRGKLAYINRSGHVTIEDITKVMDIYSFVNGLALVKTESGMMYIDHQGAIVWQGNEQWNPELLIDVLDQRAEK